MVPIASRYMPDGSVYNSVTGSGAGVTGMSSPNAGTLWLSVNYIKTKVTYYLSGGPADGNPPPPGATICGYRWFIQPDKIYAPGGGYNPLSNTPPGSPASINMEKQDDGLSGFTNKFYTRNLRNSVPYSGPHPNSYYVKSGSGYTFTFAATIFGIGIQAETDHSSDTWQQDNWYEGCRNDALTGRHDCLHWAWGSNQPADAADTPKLFYNY